MGEIALLTKCKNQLFSIMIHCLRISEQYRLPFHTNLVTLNWSDETFQCMSVIWLFILWLYKYTTKTLQKLYFHHQFTSWMLVNIIKEYDYMIAWQMNYSFLIKPEVLPYRLFYNLCWKCAWWVYRIGFKGSILRKVHVLVYSTFLKKKWREENKTEFLY